MNTFILRKPSFVMIPSSFHKAGKIFFACCCIIFFVLVIRKIVTMGITYDEAYSFLHHARSSLQDIFLYTGGLPANNHILNTLSMKLFTSLFGVSELTVRALSIVGTLLFLFGLYRITAHRGEKKTIIRFIAPVIFLANPYVYDFLVAARGYSLSLGLMMLGLSYFLPALTEKHTKKNFHGFMICFFLMTISNISFLNVFLAVIGTYRVVTLFTAERRTSMNRLVHQYGLMGLYSIILGLLLIVPIKSMRLQNDLRFGGTESIFTDTYLSIIQSYLYENTHTIAVAAISIFCVMVLLAACRYAVMFFRKKKKAYKPITIVFVMFVLVSLSIVMQHLLIGTPYVIQRTAIYFFPLFTLMILLLIECRKKIQRRMLSISVIGGGLMIYHFTVSHNVTHIPIRRADMYTEQVVKELHARALNHHATLAVGIDRVNEPAMEFYLLKHGISTLDPFIIGNTQQEGDMYYVLRYTYSGIYKSGLSNRIRILRDFPDAQMVLFTIN